MATWFVTFHGGDGSASINNIVAYTTAGAPIGPAGVLSGAGSPPLRELRGFTVGPDGNLYVVNGYKRYSQVLRFAPPAPGYGDQYTYLSPPFADTDLKHPFDAVFGPDQNLYVSSQDSNRVTCYHGPSAETPGKRVKEFVLSGFKAVRGIACDGTHWYVADSGNDGVAVFDLQGASAGSIGVDQPVHLLFDGSRYLYIGSEKDDAVLYYDTAGSAVAAGSTVEATPLISGGFPAIDKTAGLALGGDGCLYVASRMGGQILRYTLQSLDPPTWQIDGKPGGVSVFACALTDAPEFVKLIG